MRKVILRINTTGRKRKATKVKTKKITSKEQKNWIQRELKKAQEELERINVIHNKKTENMRGPRTQEIVERKAFLRKRMTMLRRMNRGN